LPVYEAHHEYVERLVRAREARLVACHARRALLLSEGRDPPRSQALYVERLVRAREARLVATQRVGPVADLARCPMACSVVHEAHHEYVERRVRAREARLVACHASRALLLRGSLGSSPFHVLATRGLLGLVLGRADLLVRDALCVALVCRAFRDAVYEGSAAVQTDKWQFRTHTWVPVDEWGFRTEAIPVRFKRGYVEGLVRPRPGAPSYETTPRIRIVTTPRMLAVSASRLTWAKELRGAGPAWLSLWNVHTCAILAGAELGGVAAVGPPAWLSRVRELVGRCSFYCRPPLRARPAGCT
jgi:hypothetical protein